jgi:hypothetical protein
MCRFLFLYRTFCRRVKLVGLEMYQWFGQGVGGSSCDLIWYLSGGINPLNAKLNPICHLLALLGAHLILYISRIRVKENHKKKNFQDSLYVVQCLNLRHGQNIVCFPLNRKVHESKKRRPYFTFNLCVIRTKKRMCVNIVISGFCLGVNEIFAVLGGYVSYISSLLLMFWDNLSAPSSVVSSPVDPWKWDR